MLEYDEWAVPGEVEYAKGKAAEIEAQLDRYHKVFEDEFGAYYWRKDMRIQITEHVAGIFELKYPKDMWLDYDVTDEMLIGYFKSEGGCVDEPKIFDLPVDDIRNSLPEWDESLLPEDSWERILEKHSVRRMATDAIEHPNNDNWPFRAVSTYERIKREFNLSDAKCGKIMETLARKLDIRDKPVVFTDLEEKIADYIKYEGCGHYGFYRYEYYHCYYEPWCFPLAMSEQEIIDTIRETYINVSVKSRRRLPDKFDLTNIGWWSRYSYCHIKNYECLYQGKAGDMFIRFLFDFKNMKIVMAYPVYKQIRENQYYSNADNDDFADLVISGR